MLLCIITTVHFPVLSPAWCEGSCEKDVPRDLWDLRRPQREEHGQVWRFFVPKLLIPSDIICVDSPLFNSQDTLTHPENKMGVLELSPVGG